MNALKSMELDDEQKLDAAMPIAMPDRPDFPYGLRICLTDAEIKKLGIDPADAAVDGAFMMHAIARVKFVGKDSGPDGEKWRIECQIEEMCIDGDDDDDDETKENKRGRRTLYG